MRRESFTAARVAAFECEPGKPQTIIMDARTPGLGVRVTAHGAKSYVFETRLHGKTIRTTIGDISSWQLGTAQAEARRLKTLVDRGIDPRIEAKRSREAAEADHARAKAAAMLVSEVWDEYIAHQKEKMARPQIERGKKWGARHLRDHENLAQCGGVPKRRGAGKTRPGVLYPLLQRKLSEITGEVLVTWLNAEAIDRPTNARQGFELFRAFWRWVATRPPYSSLVNPSAVDGKELRDALPSRKAAPADDVLQREHLSLWFSAVRSLDPVCSAYLQALVITGARREEMAGLRWEDVDFQWKTLRIADKVEGERLIPLTPYLAGLLAALPRRNQWVFSSVGAKSGHLAEPRTAHNRALAIAGLPHVTLHGLRRTFISLAEWIEMPSGIVAQIAGHKPSATQERHYKRRPLDLLRVWHARYEAWMLGEAGIPVPAEDCHSRFRVIEGKAA